MFHFNSTRWLSRHNVVHAFCEGFEPILVMFLQSQGDKNKEIASIATLLFQRTTWSKMVYFILFCGCHFAKTH